MCETGQKMNNTYLSKCLDGKAALLPNSFSKKSSTSKVLTGVILGGLYVIHSNISEDDFTWNIQRKRKIEIIFIM